jgi:hypothetical protein
LSVLTLENVVNKADCGIGADVEEIG